MKVSYVLLVAAVAIGAVGLGVASELSHRDERILFVSNPLVCDGDSGRQGACLPYFRCGNYDSDAVVDGTCRVVGQCCVVEKSCDQISEARITYFTSKDYNTADPDTCSVILSSSNSIAAPAICQLHVTLEKLELSEPSATGVCEEQYLEVRGGKGDSLKICGTNDNQTLVVDVEGRDGPFKVSVVTLKENEDSEWEVKVVQVPCDSDDLAPRGCDQYLTGNTGELKSFNYDTKPSSKIYENTNFVGSRHLQESYTICVRPEEGHCGIKWSAAPSAEEDKYAFTITDNLTPINGEVFVGVKTDIQCAFTDYLVIPEAHEEGTNEATTIICGSQFPTAVYSTSFRIYMEANTEELADEEVDNRGFHLKYEQQLCD